MKGFNSKVDPNDIPLSSIKRKSISSIDSGLLYTHSLSDQERARPDSPDSTTPLRKATKESKSNIFINKMSPDIVDTNSIAQQSYTLSEKTIKKQDKSERKFRLPIIYYYIAYGWFLLKNAASRTMSLPIAYSESFYTEKSDVARPVLIGKTLKIFSAKNPMRRFLAYLLRSEIFEVFLTFVIILHFFILATTTWPTYEKGMDRARKVSPASDIFLLAIFVIYSFECIARIIVGGLINDSIKYPNRQGSQFGEAKFGQKRTFYHRISSTRSAYLRKSFNRLDALCIIAYWVAFGVTNFTDRTRFISTISAMRIFRLLNFASGSQVVLKSLKTSSSLLVNVFLLIAFFLLCYSIIGTTSFKNSLTYKCYMMDNGEPGELNIFDYICGSYHIEGGGLMYPEEKSSPFNVFRNSEGYSCALGQICAKAENPNDGKTSFDNLLSSFVYVFITGTGQSWSDIMYSTFYGTSSAAAVFFILVVVTLNFWLLNMFVAVISQVFSNLRSNQQSPFSNKSMDLIKDVKSEEQTKNMNERSSKVHLTENIENNRDFPYKRKKWWSFKRNSSIFVFIKFFWLLLILVNIGALGTKSYHSSKQEVMIIDIICFITNTLFLVEIPLRYFLWEGIPFFQKWDNTFDSLIALINFVSTLINLIIPYSNYRYLTIFQVVRFYRIAWALPNVQTLLYKVTSDIYGIGNMILFVFILIFLSASIALQYFGGKIPKEDDDGEIFQRFDNFGWSFLALYQVFSGEDWSKVLFQIMKTEDTSSVGIFNTIISVVFVFLFFGISNFILANLFVAVLVENLELSDKEKRKIQLENYFKSLEGDHKRLTTYLSPWNIYRYIRPDPKKLKVLGLPNSLLLDVKSFDAEQFLKQYQSKSQKIKHQSSLIEKLEKFNIKGAIKRRGKSGNVKMGGTEEDSNEDSVKARLLTFIAQNEKEDNELYGQHFQHISLERQEFMEVHPTYDKPLFLFSHQSKIRRFCQMVSGSRDHPEYPFPPFSVAWLINKCFLAFIIVSVITNIGITLMQTPSNILSPYYMSFFHWTDGFFLIVFSIDVAINVIANGFLFTPDAYLRSFWNIPYFIALVISFIDYYASFVNAEGLSRFARAGKAFRVLRLINFSNTAKFTLDAVLVSGFSKLFDAAIVALCFLIPWAIYLQNVFSGLLFSCNDDKVDGFSSCVGEFLDPKLGILVPRVWANPYKYSFDNFSNSLRLLFEITSGEGWTDVMENSMKIKGFNLQPEPYVSWFNSLFFISFNFMVSVSMLSLFVSVIIDNFTTRSGSALLSPEQRKWKDFVKILKNIQPPKHRPDPPRNVILSYIHYLATAKKTWFTRLIGVVYVINFLILATERESMTQLELYIKTSIQLIILLICAVEIMIKIIGLRIQVYFFNIWNVLYFILVSVSITVCFIRFADIGFRFNHNLLNFCLLLISLRLMSMVDAFHQLLQTLKASAKSIFNLFFVWLILFLVYAIIFIQVFGNTRIGPNTSDYINFYSPANALLLLVRFSQGEGWNSVMYDFTVQSPNCVIDNPSQFLSSDCGSPGWSYTLFMSFNILSMYIFLNMFVGVIVDNFSFCYEIKEGDDGDSATTSDMLSRDQIRDYKLAWIKVDTRRTQYIPIQKIVKFLMSLKHPFNCHIYKDMYSIKNMVEVSMFNQEKDDLSSKSNGDKTTPNLKIINSLLRTMSEEECKERKHRLNSIYHELRLLEKPGKGVHFTTALLVLSRFALTDPISSFEIKDLIKLHKLNEEASFQMHMEKVLGMLSTFILRRRFLNYLQTKRSKDTKQVPTLKIQTTDLDLSDREEYSASPNTSNAHSLPSPLRNRASSLTSLISSSSIEEMDSDTAKLYIDSLKASKWNDAFKKLR